MCMQERQHHGRGSLVWEIVACDEVCRIGSNSNLVSLRLQPVGDQGLQAQVLNVSLVVPGRRCKPAILPNPSNEI